jgi:hypothetical protein
VGKTLTDAMVVEMYTTAARIASQGGPYAGIVDYSGVVESTISAPIMRRLAGESPAIPAGTLRVLVAPVLIIYGFSRMLELLRDGMDGMLQVVRSLDDAYALLGVEHGSFIHRLYPSG